MSSLLIFIIFLLILCFAIFVGINLKMYKNKVVFGGGMIKPTESFKDSQETPTHDIVETSDNKKIIVNITGSGEITIGDRTQKKFPNVIIKSLNDNNDVVVTIKSLKSVD